MYNNYNEDYLMHYGVKGMRWGHRKARPEPSNEKFRASNGLEVAAPKNAYVKVMRKVASARPVEKYSANAYRNSMQKRHTNTLTNRLETAKGEQRIHKEAQAIREYNAHQKDLRKGSGTKYLDKAVRKNKLDDAYEKVQSSATRMDRFIYSDKVRKKAAKYMVDKNMSMKDAHKKAKGNALKTTAVLLGAYGALAVSELHRNGAF